MDERPSPEDPALLERVRAGEPQAARAFFETHQRPVRALLTRLVGPDLVDDALQEVFLRAFGALGSYRGESSLRRWLLRIATNCGLRIRSRLQSDRERLRRISGPAGASPPDPEVACLAEESRRTAADALMRLVPRDREILMLREVLGLTYEEIRDRLDLETVGTVKSRLHTARESLRTAYHARRPPRTVRRTHG